MADLLLTRAQLRAGVTIATGELHQFQLVSEVKRVRLVGMFFDLNKCFLLPSAVPGIKAIKKQYDAHPQSNLLVVGHTDTSGKEDYNATLSVERADALAAYLTDAVAAWEAFFGADKAAEKRWGTREVQHMLSALPDGGSAFFQADVDGEDGPITQAAVKEFQKSKGLAVDGVAGPVTRKALITSYMAIDGTTLPAGIKLTTHGAGESFPVANTADAQRSPEDRRVEIFFFDGPITPPPPGKTSAKGGKEYPQWLAQVTETVDFTTGPQAEAQKTCHLAFTLHSPLDDKPVTQAKFDIDLGQGQKVSGTTDGSGNLDGGDVAPGDYALRIAGITMSLPAIPKSESRRLLELRPDQVEA